MLFTYYSLSSAGYPEEPRCPQRNRVRPVPLRPRVSHGRVRPGAPKNADAAPLTFEFVGMASYAPTYFLDLMDDDVESDGSSIGDVAPSYRPSRECAMADPPGLTPL